MSVHVESRLRVAAGRPRWAPVRASRDTGVVVVGGGAAAALTVISLSNAGLHPVLVADGSAPGRGVAYSTPDPLHRLNVPAGRMSASAQDPDSFVRWVRAHGDPDAGAGDFLPRAWYGDYLSSQLEDLVSMGKARLLRGRVRAISPVRGADRPGALVLLEDGSRLRARALVLATGCPPPLASWAPVALARDTRLVLDPWVPGKLDEIAGAKTGPRKVLLVGTGLTMVDVALSVAERNPLAQIVAVSRSGLLPSAHRSKPSPAIATLDVPAGRMSLEAVRELVAASITTALRETGDWRPGIDALRPVTAALWSALSLPDRARFLREDRRRWDTLRHRMSPQIFDAVTGLLPSGRLKVQPLGSRSLDDFPWQEFDSIVACVGQGGPLDTDPLLAGMLADGSIRPDALGLGLDCDLAGRPIGSTGRVWSEVTVIGALRRGQLWESTAVPELRGQAAAVAARLAPAGRSVRLMAPR